MFERLRNAGKLKVPSRRSAAFCGTSRRDDGPRRTACRPTRSPTTPGPAARAGTTSIYWRYGEYVGVGPGAHGRILTNKGRRAHATEPHPEMWLTCVETEGHGLVEDELLSTEEQGDEFLLMGLRLAEGIEPTQFEALSRRMLDQSRIASLVEEGMVEMTQYGRLRVSAAGFPLLDTVVADLAA